MNMNFNNQHWEKLMTLISGPQNLPHAHEGPVSGLI